MRKVLLGIAAAATVLFGSVEMADAQQRGGYGNRGGYAQQYRGGQNYYRGGNRYVQNNYYGGRRGGWNGNGAAWAAGGLAVGALLGAAIAQPNYGYAQPYWGGGAVAAPVCQPVIVGRYWNGFNWVPQYAPGC
jgi:hypothetical protein